MHKSISRLLCALVVCVQLFVFSTATSSVNREVGTNIIRARCVQEDAGPGGPVGRD